MLYKPDNNIDLKRTNSWISGLSVLETERYSILDSQPLRSSFRASKGLRKN